MSRSRSQGTEVTIVTGDVFGMKLLSVFEEISLKSTLDSVKVKHNLRTVKKVRISHGTMMWP